MLSNVFSLLVSKAFVKVLLKTPNYQQRKINNETV